MEIIKQELQFEECLKQKLEFICELMLKDIDEEYRTTLVNFGLRKYFNINFAMVKLMEMETTEQNKVALYLFNHIKI